MSGYLEAVLVLLAINVILAYSASLPLAAGQLNLGIAGFMAIGAYTGAFLTNELGISLWVAVPAGGALSALIAVLIGIPMLRTHGIYMALATFSLGEVIKATFLNLEIVGGAAGYPVYEYVDSHVVWIVAACVVVFMWVLSQTRFALYLTAIKNDTTVTDLFGVNVKAVQLAALTLGAAIAGIGGAVYAHHFSYVEAQYFSAHLNIFIALYVLLGGVQTIYGPLMGAVFFTLLPELLRFGAEWRFAMFAALIILIMAWRPEGLMTSNVTRRIAGVFGR